MKSLRKIMIYTMAVILATGVASALDINSSQDLNYFNSGQIQFQVDTSGNIQSYGNLDLNNNQLQRFFGSACPSGETVVDVNDDGTFQCMDVSNEVSSDYVSRSGDSMTGALTLSGQNDIYVGDSGEGRIRIWHNNNRRMIFAPYDDGGWQWGREFGYENSTNQWYVENGLDVKGGSLDMNGNSIMNGAVCPDGSCSKGSYETFDASGIGTTNIYDGSGGEIDIQSQINFNSNNVKNIKMATALDMNGNQIRAADEAWVSKNNQLGTYEWSQGPSGQKADLKTRSIEIVDDNTDDSTTNPWIALHDYGGGGPRLRFNYSTSTIYLEEQQGRDDWSAFKIDGGKVTGANHYETNDGLTLGACGGDNCIDVNNDLHLNHNNGNNVQIGDSGGHLIMNSQNIQQVNNVYGSTSTTDIYSNGGGRVLLRARGSGGTLGWYDDYNNNWVQKYNNGGDLELDPVGNDIRYNGNNIREVNNVYFNGGEQITSGTNLNLISESGYIDVEPSDGSHGLIMRDYDGSSTSWGGIRVVNSNRMEFRMDSGSYGGSLVIGDNNNVGIGDTSPGTKLDVSGKARATRLEATSGMVLPTGADAY